jgi:predicted Zn finger-like uncharacterized protein
MPVVTQCPDCSAKIRVSDNAVGKQIKCPKCSSAFTATAADGGSSPAIQAPPPKAPAKAAAPKPAPAPAPAPPPPAPSPPAAKDDEPADGADASAAATSSDDEWGSATDAGPARRRKKAPDFGDYLAYRAFFTPTIGIQILFFLGSGYFIYLGARLVGVAVDAINYKFTAGFELLLWALGFLFGGPFVMRVICEVIVAIFRILETLKEQH